MLVRLIGVSVEGVAAAEVEGTLGVERIVGGTVLDIEGGASEYRVWGSVLVDGEWLNRGSLGSISSLAVDGVFGSSLSGMPDPSSKGCPYRLGGCRFRVFFRIPPRVVGLSAGVVLPPRVDILLRGIIF